MVLGSRAVDIGPPPLTTHSTIPEYVEVSNLPFLCIILLIAAVTVVRLVAAIE